MNCLDDIHMEKLVLNELGGESPPPNIYLHISGCPLCQDRWDEQKAFYHEARHAFVQLPSLAEEVLAQAVESPPELTTFLTVHPYSPRVVAPAQAGQVAIMAADTGFVSRSQAHRRLGLLADKQRSVLVRLMQSLSTNLITGHLMADNPALIQYVLMRMAGQLFASDRLGRVAMEGVAPGDIENQVVQIQLPCAIFKVSDMLNSSAAQSQATGIRILNEAREVIRLQFPTSYPEHSVAIDCREFATGRGMDDPDQLHLLLSQSSTAGKLAKVIDGTALFEGVTDGEELIIRVFE